MIGRYSVYRSPIKKNDDDNGDDKKKPNQAQDFQILPFEVFFPPNL